MRKALQKQILELIDTLGSAQDQIKRYIAQREITAAVQLLADCQDVADQINSAIERIEGADTKTASLLGDYCKLLYHTSVEITQENGGVDVIWQIQKQLAMIEASVETEMKPDKIEVVFLPYKASMFDAMESIWLAARDDPQCDAYVVPIPYYDRLPNGELGQMHDESGQYPADVPITDWREYDIGARHPDIIFFHAPYDGDNYVTSVHPDYYSERLRNETDLLVYVPYFVCIEEAPAHLCVCAGVRFADKVIVQSEKVRQNYIDAFREFERKHRCKGQFGNPLTKFVALGSPKFDKVVRAASEPFSLCEEWKRVIEKPDGARRKTVLLNTSLGAILEGGERYLEKLRSVLDCFRARDDIALLWRPHPLSEATYQSMRPQLLADYMRMTEDYRRAGWGIFDGSPDLHRAIAVSDAYYGDWSSLVAMYQRTGKPIMILEGASLSEEDGFYEPAFETLFDDGQALWFTSHWYNALFKLDKRTREAEYMGSFPGEAPYGWRLYGGIAAVEGKLYFAPVTAKEIAEYDIAAKRFRKIALDPAGVRLATFQFFSAVSYKKWVFFLPLTYQGILRYDTETGALDCFCDWVAPLTARKRVSELDSTFFFKDVCVTDSRIVAGACCANAALVFDMDGCEARLFEVGGETCAYGGVCFDGRDYWFSPRHGGPVVKWNLETGQTVEYGDYPPEYAPCDYSFDRAVLAEGRLWLIPSLANQALAVRLSDGKSSVADALSPVRGEDPEGTGGTFRQFLGASVIDGVIYTYSTNAKRLILYDPRSGHREETAVSLTEAAACALRAVRLDWVEKDIDACASPDDFLFHERVTFELPVFLDYITGGADHLARLREGQIALFREENAHPDGEAGAAIYGHCKDAAFREEERK